jgi:hypothetical protein
VPSSAVSELLSALGLSPGQAGEGRKEKTLSEQWAALPLQDVSNGALDEKIAVNRSFVDEANERLSDFWSSRAI